MPRISFRLTCALFIFIFVQIVCLLYFESICIAKPEFGSSNFNTVTAISRESVGALFLEFNPEKHDLRLNSFSNFLFHELIVVSQRKIYPIQDAPPCTKFIQLGYDLHDGNDTFASFSSAKTEWLLIIPDGVASTASGNAFWKLLESLPNNADNPSTIWAFKVKGRRASCQSIFYDHKRWTLSTNTTSKFSTNWPVCDSVVGTVVFLIRKLEFLRMRDPFALPVAENLMLNSIKFGWRTRFVSNITWFTRTESLLDPQILSFKLHAYEENLRILYRKFDIKKVVSDGQERLYGCNKTSSRCFPTIYNEKPSFLYEGRYLPPCCAAALKTTLRHVRDILENAGARYWLEGGSLLGAARNGDIIPWDYDIDLGIYLEDKAKVQYLQAASTGPVEDPDGFVWEMSQPEEGRFFRVHFSRLNRLHVDIFPFYPNNASIMTKEFWFKTHPQDREFPESFLKPLDSIRFMGMDISAPNNVKDFLELKFGKGAIENPRHPLGSP